MAKLEKKIYYHDTDAGGVVYYANYLKYFEEGRTEFFEKRHISIKELHNQGFLYAVRKCSVTYKSPARYGDTIICKTEVTKITAAQIFFKQEISNKETGQLVAEADIALVSLDKNFKTATVPEHIKSAIV